MVYYTLTIFLSAFLLFALQPLMGKYLLPWFGGGAGIWTACMLFFQCVLLCGYSYAHLLSKHLSQSRQANQPLGARALSIFLLPIAPGASWKPPGAESPTREIIFVLIVHVGVPFALLAATGPLLSRWFSRAFPERAPYRLYALSNAGSLLALLSYPFLIEPFLALPLQASLWAIGYGAFILLCANCALQYGRLPGLAPIAANNATENIPLDQSSAPTMEPEPSKADKLLWLALAANASLMLLASTHKISQDLAVIPLLWVLPLAIYLLSFILCFDHQRWYRRWIFGPLFVVGSLAVVYMLPKEQLISIWIQIGVFATTLFAVCMICHGELVRLKPRASALTEFYLVIACGGALGGILVAVVAPYVFNDYWEYHLGLITTALLAMICARRHQLRQRKAMQAQAAALAMTAERNSSKRKKRNRDKQSAAEIVRPYSRVRSLLAWSGVAVIFLLIVVGLARDIRQDRNRQIASSRSFYGVTHILQPSNSVRLMEHGRTIHGGQFLSRSRRREPTTYYEPDSGIGIALSEYRELQAAALNIGVIGLGAGAIAAYAQPGDRIRYYEIDANVERLAREYFSFIDDSEAQLDVILGDARIMLEHEAANNELQAFDLLVVDAFNSDAVPLHLLTREAMELYLSHLKPQGLLAFHVTNRYLNLGAVIRGLAQHTKHEAVRLYTTGSGLFSYASDWVVLTRNPAFLQSQNIRIAATDWSDTKSLPIAWTDDYASLWSAVLANSEIDPGKWETAANFGRFAMDEANLLTQPELRTLRNLGRKLYHDSAGDNAIVLMTIPERPLVNGKQIPPPAYIEGLYRQYSLDEYSNTEGILLLISVADDLAFMRAPKDWSESRRQSLIQIVSTMMDDGTAAQNFSSRVVAAVEAMHSLVRSAAGNQGD